MQMREMNTVELNNFPRAIPVQHIVCYNCTMMFDLCRLQKLELASFSGRMRGGDEGLKRFLVPFHLQHQQPSHLAAVLAYRTWFVSGLP